MSAQNGENKDVVRPWRRWKARHTSLALTVLVAGLLLIADRKDPDAMNPALLVGIAVATGFFGGAFHARGLGLALSGLLCGLAVGVFSSLDFFFLPVVGAYYAVLSSLVVYVMLGLLAGGFAETVRFLHFAAHGGKPRDYRSPKTVK